MKPCQGMNCTSTDGTNHSPECEAEHAAAIAGGRFVKDGDLFHWNAWKWGAMIVSLIIWALFFTFIGQFVSCLT